MNLSYFDNHKRNWKISNENTCETCEEIKNAMKHINPFEKNT